jgi:hypothetical protein
MTFNLKLLMQQNGLGSLLRKDQLFDLPQAKTDKSPPKALSSFASTKVLEPGYKKQLNSNLGRKTSLNSTFLQSDNSMIKKSRSSDLLTNLLPAYPVFNTDQSRQSSLLRGTSIDGKSNKIGLSSHIMKILPEKITRKPISSKNLPGTGSLSFSMHIPVRNGGTKQESKREALVFGNGGVLNSSHVKQMSPSLKAIIQTSRKGQQRDNNTALRRRSPTQTKASYAISQPIDSRTMLLKNRYRLITRNVEGVHRANVFAILRQLNDLPKGMPPAMGLEDKISLPIKLNYGITGPDQAMVKNVLTASKHFMGQTGNSLINRYVQRPNQVLKRSKHDLYQVKQQQPLIAARLKMQNRTANEQAKQLDRSYYPVLSAVKSNLLNTIIRLENKSGTTEANPYPVSQSIQVSTYNMVGNSKRKLSKASGANLSYNKGKIIPFLNGIPGYDEGSLGSIALQYFQRGIINNPSKPQSGKHRNVLTVNRSINNIHLNTANSRFYPALLLTSGSRAREGMLPWQNRVKTVGRNVSGFDNAISPAIRKYNNIYNHSISANTTPPTSESQPSPFGYYRYSRWSPIKVEADTPYGDARYAVNGAANVADVLSRSQSMLQRKQDFHYNLIGEIGNPSRVLNRANLIDRSRARTLPNNNSRLLKSGWTGTNQIKYVHRRHYTAELKSNIFQKKIIETLIGKRAPDQTQNNYMGRLELPVPGWKKHSYANFIYHKTTMSTVTEDKPNRMGHDVKANPYTKIIQIRDRKPLTERTSSRMASKILPLVRTPNELIKYRGYEDQKKIPRRNSTIILPLAQQISSSAGATKNRINEAHGIFTKLLMVDSGKSSLSFSDSGRPTMIMRQAATGSINNSFAMPGKSGGINSGQVRVKSEASNLRITGMRPGKHSFTDHIYNKTAMASAAGDSSSLFGYQAAAKMHMNELQSRSKNRVEGRTSSRMAGELLPLVRNTYKKRKYRGYKDQRNISGENASIIVPFAQLLSSSLGSIKSRTNEVADIFRPSLMMGSEKSNIPFSASSRPAMIMLKATTRSINNSLAVPKSSGDIKSNRGRAKLEALSTASRDKGTRESKFGLTFENPKHYQDKQTKSDWVQKGFINKNTSLHKVPYSRGILSQLAGEGRYRRAVNDLAVHKGTSLREPNRVLATPAKILPFTHSNRSSLEAYQSGSRHFLSRTNNNYKRDNIKLGVLHDGVRFKDLSDGNLMPALKMNFGVKSSNILGFARNTGGKLPDLYSEGWHNRFMDQSKVSNIKARAEILLNRISPQARLDKISKGTDSAISSGDKTRQPVNNSHPNLIPYRGIKAGDDKKLPSNSQLATRPDLNYRQETSQAKSNNSDSVSDTQVKSINEEIKTQIAGARNAELKATEINKIADRVYREIQQRMKMERQRRGL